MVDANGTFRSFQTIANLLVNGSNVASTATPISDVQRILIGTCVMIVIFLILFGNSMTLLSFLTRRRLRRRRYFPVASLAVADLLVGLSAVLFMCNRFIIERMNGDTQTAELIFMIVLYQSTNASAYHLVVLAVDRFVAARFPMHYRRTMTTARIVTMTACCWIASLLTIAPYFAWLPPERRQSTRRNDTCYQFEGRNGPVPLLFDLPIQMTLWILVSIIIIGLTLNVFYAIKCSHRMNKDNGFGAASRRHSIVGKVHYSIAIIIYGERILIETL